MSYTEAYGLKFNYKKLKEILREKYAERASEKWEKYILCYMVDELSKDLLKDHPKHKIEIFCTAFEDAAGDDCVLGIEMVRYTLVNRSQYGYDLDEYCELEETTFRNFEDFTRYWDHKYGDEIHELEHLKSPHQKEYNVAIDAMKKLIGSKEVQKMKPSIYRIEDCSC